MTTIAKTFDFGGVKAAFLASGFGLILNSQKVGEWLELKGNVSAGFGLGAEAVQSGAVSAFLSAYKHNAYSTLEIGLHLLRSADSAIITDDAGYVTSRCTNPDFVEFAPVEDDGVNVLGKRQGSRKDALGMPIAEYYVEQQFRAANIPVPSKLEAKEITFGRNVCAKHLTLDVLLSGAKLHIAPSFFTGTYGVDSTPDFEARKRWIARYEQIFAETVEENTESYAQNIAQKGVNRIAAQVNAAVERGEEVETPTTVLSVDGTEINVINLLGKRIRWYQGRRMLGAEAGFLVTPENLVAKLAVIRQGGLAVEFVPAK